MSQATLRCTCLGTATCLLSHDACSLAFLEPIPSTRSVASCQVSESALGYERKGLRLPVGPGPLKNSSLKWLMMQHDMLKPAEGHVR